MSYGTCTSCFRKAQLNVAYKCAACQISSSVKDSSTPKTPESTDWMDWDAIPYGVLFVYVIAICFKEPQELLLFGNKWIEAVVTFLIGSLTIGYIKDKSDSGSKLFKFVLIAINLIIIYLLLKGLGVFD